MTHRTTTAQTAHSCRSCSHSDVEHGIAGCLYCATCTRTPEEVRSNAAAARKLGTPLNWEQQALRFEREQVRRFVRRVEAEAGCGWEMLGPRVQRALIAEGALRVLMEQMSSDIPVGVIRGLYRDMLVEAGLTEEG